MTSEILNCGVQVPAHPFKLVVQNYHQFAPQRQPEYRYIKIIFVSDTPLDLSSLKRLAHEIEFKFVDKK